MKKKRCLFTVIALLLAVLVLAVYPLAKENTIRESTSDYVVSLGYPAESIKEIKVLHSYTNRILGFNEWRISVEFKEKPNLWFWFTYRKDAILYQGVSAEPMLKDKDIVIEYSERFKAGTLLSD